MFCSGTNELACCRMGCQTEPGSVPRHVAVRVFASLSLPPTLHSSPNFHTLYSTKHHGTFLDFCTISALLLPSIRAASPPPKSISRLRHRLVFAIAPIGCLLVVLYHVQRGLPANSQQQTPILRPPRLLTVPLLNKASSSLMGLLVNPLLLNSNNHSTDNLLRVKGNFPVSCGTKGTPGHEMRLVERVRLKRGRYRRQRSPASITQATTFMPLLLIPLGYSV